MRQAVQVIPKCGLVWAAVVVALTAVARAEGPPPVSDGESPVSLEILPASIVLDGSNRRQQLVVTAVARSGRRWDITRRSEYRLAEPQVASLVDTHLAGVHDGTSQLIVRFGSLAASVPVTTAGSSDFPPVHFTNDVVPLFSALRCNSGGCHGKSTGQNGFKLSVFGFDPIADHAALVKEGRGRRVSPAAPQQSLLLRKATGLVPHGGGRRMEPDSPEAELLRQWLAQGMPWGTDDAPALRGIDVYPAERILAARADQQILVTAIYSDGGRRDVTHAASYTSNADTIAAVDERGFIQTGDRPGEAAITVNYMGQVGATRVLVPRSLPALAFPELSANHRIDELVWAKLRKLGMIPSEPCSDAVFLRRVYLDAAGTPPPPETVRTFLADASPDKRSKVIDQVLESREFADFWALKWSDVLLVNSASLGSRGAYELHRWLREQVASNRPYDAWVRELITATGNSGKYGPANFYRALRTPPDQAKTVSQAFLGIRLDCAQCHHHPYEKWGQEDFYGLAGYFNGLEYKPLSATREFVYHRGAEPAQLPLTGKPVPIHALDEEPREIQAADPRMELADWLVSRENPWFARLVANRLWKNFLGRGLVEPEDDLRSTNPATNEPLLEYLTAQVVAGDFDLKHVMRLILNSRVYQLSSDPNASNADDEQNFSHYLVRRLPAEVLLDAISEVTGSPEQFPGWPSGTRSIQLWDNRLPSYFLETFGRSGRESPCECAKSSDPTMAQTLHLMNAPEIQAKISSPNGRIARWLARGADPDAIVTELCLAALGREPGTVERSVAADLFARQPPRQAAEDFCWAMLNSYEFLFAR